MSYCNSCPDRLSDECALPPAPVRFIAKSIIVIAALVDATALASAAKKGRDLSTDSMGIIQDSKDNRDAIYAPVAACILLHTINNDQIA